MFASIPVRKLWSLVAPLLTLAALGLGAASADASQLAVPSPSSSPAASPRTGAQKPAATLTGFTVTLTASPVALTPGGTTTLTATINQPLNGMAIEIFDLTGRMVVGCDTRLSCSAPETQNTGAVVQYAAFVMPFSPDFPPANFVAKSTALTVTWLTTSLTGSALVMPVGTAVTLTALTRADVSGQIGFSGLHLMIFDVSTSSVVADCDGGLVCQGTVDLQCTNCPVISKSGTSVTLTATTSFNVGPTPDFIEIFDITTGTRVSPACGTGTTCTATVSNVGHTTHDYIALVSDNNSAFPPNFHLKSFNRIVVWS
jgi:hypothetical protein